MSQRLRYAGWALTLLIALFMGVVSAGGKFASFEGKAELFAHLGWSESAIMVIGVLEIVVALLMVIPQTALVGTILVTAYLGGATATHVRVGDPWFVPVLIGVAAWVAFGLRFPERLRPALGLRADG
jgi:hypothetical protein